MPKSSNEDQTLLAIQAIQTSPKKLSQRRAAAMYGIPQRTLSDRMRGKAQRAITHIKQHKLNPSEEQVLIQYMLDQDARGFSLHLSDLEDMANLLLQPRDRQPVDKH